MQTITSDEIVVMPEAPIIIPGAEPQVTEPTTPMTPAEAARVQAAELFAGKKYVEARKALQEAERLESTPAKWKSEATRIFSSVQSKLPKRERKSELAAAEEQPVSARLASARKSVALYSKIAAGVGILPGGLLNFAAISVVQTLMVWRIAHVYDNKSTKEKIRGYVFSLIGSVIPTAVGHGAGLAVASIPAAIAGAAIYFIATPLLAYALTRAVGNTFIMHFESGGTLLTFDPKAFTGYFIGEFRKAGGVLPEEMTPSVVAS